MVSVHRFDAAQGVMAAQPLAAFKGAGIALAAVDMCVFLRTGPGQPYRILVVDQGADALASFAFDAEQRTITSTGDFIARLSFPHGVDVSADGRFIAITNYGDDSVRIARLSSAVTGASVPEEPADVRTPPKAARSADRCC